MTIHIGTIMMYKDTICFGITSYMIPKMLCIVVIKVIIVDATNRIFDTSIFNLFFCILFFRISKHIPIIRKKQFVSDNLAKIFSIIFPPSIIILANEFQFFVLQTVVLYYILNSNKYQYQNSL